VSGQAIFLSKSLELCHWGFNFLGTPYFKKKGKEFSLPQVFKGQI